jgi:putative ABC transport system permease protein
MIDYVRTLSMFYRRHLRVQPVRELMAVAGVAAGVALLLAVQIAHHSITASFAQLAHGLSGRATLELSARGPGGFDERVAGEVEAMTAVKAAAPVVQQPVIAVGRRGRQSLTLVGAGEQIGSLAGSLSAQFQRAGEASRRGLLVLTEPTARAIGARPGDVVTLLIRGRSERLVLDATVPSAKLGSLADSQIAAAPLPVVQSLAGMQGRVSRVLVEPDAGREAHLRRALAARFGAIVDVRPSDTEARLLGAAAKPEDEVTLLFSAISLVAGMLLAYNALLLAGDERRRFISYLIESGTPDRMILASVVFDACVLGLAGSLLGVLAGDAISLLAYHATPGYIAAAFAIGHERVLDGSTLALALAAGMLAAFAAAALPASAALRAGAAAEPEAVGRALSLARRGGISERLVFACGALLVCAAAAVSLLAPTLTVGALVGLAVGLVLCLPTILRRLLALVHAATRRVADPAARVCVAELRSAPARSVALLATGTIAVFLTVVIGGAVADVQHAVRRGARDVVSGAQVWVRPGAAENVYTTDPFADGRALRALGSVRAVRSVLPWRDSFLDLRGRRVWVVGVPPQLPAQIAPSQIVEGQIGAADRRIREGGWVAISRVIARERHLHVGARLTLPTPSGFASVRLAATITNYGWLSGAIVMNGAEHARLWEEAAGASELAVSLRPGVSPAQGRREVRAALAGERALTVQTSAERRTEVSAVLGSTLSRLTDTTVVVLVSTVASVIALMLAAIWQRRERLNSLMAIGMSAGQLSRLIFYESGSVLLCGCVLGMLGGLLGQGLIDNWLHHTTDSPVQFAPAWQIGLRTIALAAGVSLLAALAPLAQVGRLQPRAAFSLE